MRCRSRGDGRPRKYGVPVVAPRPRTHPLTRRVTGVAPRHRAGLGAAPPPAGARGRCTHLPQVWRQVWLRGAELRWAQRGSDPESGGGGDELGFEVGTSQGRLRGFQEPSLEAEHLKVSAVDPAAHPSQVATPQSGGGLALGSGHTEAVPTLVLTSPLPQRLCVGERRPLWVVSDLHVALILAGCQV